MLVACIASGPSATPAAAARLRGRCRVMCVSNAYELAPWADWMFAADRAWWDQYGSGTAAFAGERWSMGVPARPKPWQAGLKLVPRGAGGVPAEANNSGLMALHLASLLGAKRVLLVGYDLCEPTPEQLAAAGLDPSRSAHFFGDHPPALRRFNRYPKFVAAFDQAAPAIAAAGVAVVNCSPITALSCFPKAPLEEALR